MLQHYQLSPLTVEQVAPFVGNGVKPLVQRALEFSMKDTPITPELFNEAFNLYFSAYQQALRVETYLYPGVLETLNYLHQKGYVMAVCTNKPYRFIEPILEQLQIKPFFTHWIGEDSLPEKKPSAAPLLHLANKENLSINECIMVGDSKNDILAAQNAGMESIGLSYGYNYNENIAEYNPSVVADDFSALKGLL
jgi:phosphoglycolate phosphatase